MTIFTARKQSCGKVMFLHVSVNLFTGMVGRGVVTYPILGTDTTSGSRHPFWDQPLPLILDTTQTTEAGGTHPTGLLRYVNFFWLCYSKLTQEEQISTLYWHWQIWGEVLDARDAKPPTPTPLQFFIFTQFLAK